MGFKKYFISLSFVFIVGGSLAIAILNSQNQEDGFSTPTSKNPIVGKILYNLSTILHCFIIIFAGIELISRTSMSMFFVYPCDLQQRTCCCIDYAMPKFWFFLWILCLFTFIAQAALMVILFIPGIGPGYGNVSITRCAYIAGITLVEFILSIVNWKIAKVDLAKEMAGDEEEPDDGSARELVRAPSGYGLGNDPAAVDVAPGGDMGEGAGEEEYEE